ncbi:MAG: hypothetical protein QM723_26700 [Myxococcaceae bacterium]
MAEGRSFKSLWWLAVLLFLSPIVAAVIARVLTGPMPPSQHRGWGKRAPAAEVVDGGAH